MYELITGKALISPLPVEVDYNNLPGSLGEILRYIFERQSNETELLHSLDDVSYITYFVTESLCSLLLFSL